MFCPTKLPCDVVAKAAIAQLAARRSHNPKVVSSILTRRICDEELVATCFPELGSRGWASLVATGEDNPPR